MVVVPRLIFEALKPYGLQTAVFGLVQAKGDITRFPTRILNVVLYGLNKVGPLLLFNVAEKTYFLEGFFFGSIVYDSVFFHMMRLARWAGRQEWRNGCEQY